MARATNGIIAKKVSRKEIIKVLEQNYKNVKDDPKATDDYAVLVFKAGKYTRDLRITSNTNLYDSEKSGQDYGFKLPDEVTFLSMTYLDDSPEIMRNIISSFGGIVQDDDYADAGYYRVTTALRKETTENQDE